MELLIKNPELAQLASKILHGLATGDDLGNAKIEDVRAIKSDNSELHYRALAAPIERAAGDSPRSKRYIASDETVDRMGDIIRVKGWDFTRFAENPQALWAHSARDFPIGTVSGWQKTRRDGRPVLLETINYLAEGTTPAADIAWKLVDQGVIRAVSVGFYPLETKWVEDPEERQRLGLGPYGVIYESQEQLELSNCTIPANPNALGTKSIRDALVEMVKSGQITERDAESIVDLGESRTIQVQVPELPTADPLPEPEIEKTVEPEAEWLFKVNEEGHLVVVKPVETKADEPAIPEAEAEESIDVAAELAEIREAINALAERVESIVPEIKAVVGRSLRDPKQDLRRAVERAIERAGEQFPQGSE